MSVLGAQQPDGVTSVPCNVVVDFTVDDPGAVFVVVDCIPVSWNGSGTSAPDDGEYWEYEGAEQPGAIVFSDALCARLERDGFSRIDILEGCAVEL